MGVIKIEVVFKTTGLTESPRERIGGKEYKTNCQALETFIPTFDTSNRGRWEGGGGERKQRESDLQGARGVSGLKGRHQL